MAQQPPEGPPEAGSPPPPEPDLPAPPPAAGAPPTAGSEGGVVAPPAPPQAPVGAPAAGGGGRRGWIIGGAIVLVLLVAGVATAAFLTLRGSGERLLDKIPASADVVVTAYLNPSAGQKANLLRMASSFPSLGSEDEIEEQIGQAIDELFSAQGLDRRDFDWIGDQAAVAMDVPEMGFLNPSSIGVVAVIDVDDEGAARASLEELANSVPTPDSGPPQVTWAVEDGTAIVASTEGMLDAVRRTIEGDEPSMADDEDFGAATDGLPSGRLGLLYVDGSLLEGLSNLGNAFADQPGAELPGDLNVSIGALKGIGLALTAESDGLAIDVRVAYDIDRFPPELREALSAQDGPPNALLDAVPRDAFAFVGAKGIDVTLQQVLEMVRTTDPESVAWLDEIGATGDGGALDSLTGDVVIEVTPGRGTGDAFMPEGALLLGTTDEEAMQSVLDLLVAELVEEGLPGELIADGAASLDPEGVFTECAAELDGSDDSDGFEECLERVIDPDPEPQGPPEVSESEHDGVRITTLQMPEEPEVAPSWAVFDGVAVIGTTPEAVEDVIDARRGGESIEASPAYEVASSRLGGAETNFFLDVQATIDAVRDSLSSDELDEETLLNLGALRSVIAGTESGEDYQQSRFFLQIGDPAER